MAHVKPENLMKDSECFKTGFVNTCDLVIVQQKLDTSREKCDLNLWQ